MWEERWHPLREEWVIVAAHRPRRRAWVDILIAGVLIGFGAAAKWAAIYTLAGIFVAAVTVTAYAYERGRPGLIRLHLPLRSAFPVCAGAYWAISLQSLSSSADFNEDVAAAFGLNVLFTPTIPCLYPNRLNA